MNGLKTVMIYVAGAAALIGLTLAVSRQIEPLEADVPPIKTATARAAPPTPSPTAQASAGCQTTPLSRGYGYLPDAPLTTTLAPPGQPGQPIVISGTVYAADCATPLAGVVVHVWHADARGQYDREAPYTLRGQLLTNAAGQYSFQSIKPGRYRSSDGEWRPRHIHFRLNYGDEASFDTRLLFPGDSGVQPGPLMPRELRTEGETLYGVFDIVLPVPALSGTLTIQPPNR